MGNFSSKYSFYAHNDQWNRMIPPINVNFIFLLAFIRINGYSVCMRNLLNIFKSLEDETRLRIMALLLEADELCVCDLIAVLQLPQSTVSRHLAHLKNVGWVSDRRRGVWIHYSLAKDLSPIHRTFVSTLRTILAQNEVAAQDRERLTKLGTGNCCA
jgi:ArsR family transcriptional regulator, arsenate/arsenite/antimonite-responsive transcriptional repressor